MKKVIYIVLLLLLIVTYSLVSAGYGVDPEKVNIIIVQAVNESPITNPRLPSSETGFADRNIENRLKEISKRREEMRIELEKLKREEERLRDDVKKEGRLMLVRKKREMEHRSRELEEKIKRFIKELEEIDKEELRLLDSQKPM